MPSLTSAAVFATILSSVGFLPSDFSIVTPGGSHRVARSEIEAGRFVIFQGLSPEAESFGFHSGARTIVVQNIVDLRAPKLSIIWERSEGIPLMDVPKSATIFAVDRWTNAPVMAGYRIGRGAVLWMATSPGVKGYERYPYLPQALSDLGAAPHVRANNLWAFFDSSYRTRVDLDYFADRWRNSGISALHVAAWHYYEPDAQRDEFLRKLIEACHKRAILVYAWIELPHVSEKFWDDHPAWREKTALMQDAQLDWRKLMNLNNPDCARAVAEGTRAQLTRFDWDGVNLAELYFESLEGFVNPARFTPFNDNVRAAYKAEKGFDPVELLNPNNAGKLPEFLTWRAELARKMQVQWIGEIENLRGAGKPDLDLVLTHVDDRFDTRMRDLIGADAARVLPMLDHHDFTFLIEDPATIWNLGPDRYPQIAERYVPLTNRVDKLGIDINIFERYQDVYPTKLQTGAELFQLVHVAAKSFPRVALYFENSILRQDLALLPYAAAVAGKFEESATKSEVDSPRGVGVTWAGAAKVDGALWPVNDGHTVWLPPGAHKIEPAAEQPFLRLVDFNGFLESAASLPKGLEFRYQSSARALAVFDRQPTKLDVDGSTVQVSSATVQLPRGAHKVRAWLTIASSPSLPAKP
jgi:hypothetical protein